MSQDSVKIQLEIATKAAELALDKMKGKAQETNGAFQVFQGTLAGGAALAGLNALGNVISGVFGSAIEEARGAAKEVSDLNIALANSGNYSKETSDAFVQLGAELQQNTIYSQGAVVQNVALLESMTGLSKDGLMRAQKAAVELAATFNLDLNQATEMVAKAHNGNTMALEKLGIKFNETGSSAKNYEAILAEIEKRNGTAAEKGKTFEGAMAKIKNNTDDALESFGNLVIQNPLVVKGLNFIADSLAGLANAFQKAADFINRNADVLEILLAGLAAAGLALVAVAIKAGIASGAFGVLTTAAGAAWTAITGPVGLVVAAVAAVGAAVYAVYKYWDDVKAAAYNALAATLEFAAKGANALGATEKAAGLTELANKYRELAKESKAAAEAERAANAQTTTEVVNNTNTKTKILDEAAIKKQKEIDDFTAKLVKQTEDIKYQNDLQLENLQIFNESKNLIDEEQDITNFEGKLLREQEYYARKQEFLDTQLAADVARVEASRLSEDDKYKAQLALQAKYSNDSGKLANDLAKKQIDIKKAQKDEEKKINDATIQASSDLFGVLAQVAETGGEDMWAITKTFQVAQAVTAGILAVQNALTLPFPANLIAAASMGITTALNVSKIMSTQPKKYAQGGIVPGNSYVGDTVPAQVNSGEMILDKTKQNNLWRMASGTSFGQSPEIYAILSEILFAVKANQSIYIGEKEIFAVIRDGQNAGRSF